MLVVPCEVDVPAGPVRGYRFTRLGVRTYGNEVVEKLDPRGRSYFWIGGDASHEFMIPADNGEDSVLHCRSCGYAANQEKAEIGTRNCTPPSAPAGSMGRPLPGVRTEIVDGELCVDPATVPTFFLGYDGEPVPEGRWHTGDQVRQDEDGWLYFEARADDVIVRVTGGQVSNIDGTLACSIDAHAGVGPALAFQALSQQLLASGFLAYDLYDNYTAAFDATNASIVDNADTVSVFGNNVAYVLQPRDD